jgi:hypothetical protein
VAGLNGAAGALVASPAGLDLGGLGTLTLSGAGVWTLVGIVLVALIRAWPVLAKQAQEARAQLRKEKREDLDDCRKRLDAMAGRLDASDEKVRGLELKLVGAISGYRILDLELEHLAPSSVALAQARAVMSTAFAVSPSTPAAPPSAHVPAGEAKPAQ